MTINEVADGTTPIRRASWPEFITIAIGEKREWTERMRKLKRGTLIYEPIGPWTPDHQDLTATDWERAE